MKRFITVLVIMSVLFGIFSAIVLGLVFIPLLRRKRVGQMVLEYVAEHREKSGTPTMGGLIFIIATILVMAFLLLTNKVEFTKKLSAGFFGGE